MPRINFDRRLRIGLVQKVMPISLSTAGKGVALSVIAIFLILTYAGWNAQGGEARIERGVGGVSVSGGGIYRNSWAVIIGINLYARAPQLNYAVNDARSMVAAVQKLGFASDKILLLLDHEATKQRIEQILYGTLRRTTPQDRVLVFFAGHGMTSTLPRGGEEGFILPVDGDPEDLPLTAIAMADVRQIARRIPAKHILFTVDACYSGFAISRDLSPPRSDLAYLEDMTKHPAVQIITAGRKDEPVVEEEGHGIFTRRMLSGLTGPADVDGNGIITAQELAVWLGERVVQDSENKQHPQYSRLDGEGQFVFVVPGRERVPILASLDDQEKLRQEMNRVAQEAERLKRENALLEQAQKLHLERQRIELAKLDAERALLKAQAETLALERNRSEEDRQPTVEVKKANAGQTKIELAKLEIEEGRLKAEEERIEKQRTEVEKERVEAELRRQSTQSGLQPEILASIPPSRKRPNTPAPIPNVAAAPQFKVGDSWTVGFEDGRSATRTVRAIDQGGYVFDWGLDLVRYYDGNFVLHKQITADNGADVYTDLLRRKILNFPLSLKKSWEFDLSLGSTAGGRQRRAFSLRVVGIEEVQTPAGVFQAFKIEEKSQIVRCVGCPALQGTLNFRYWWFAPEVKFPVRLTTVVKQRRRDLPPIIELDEDYELVGFDLKR